MNADTIYINWENMYDSIYVYIDKTNFTNVI